MVAGKKEINFEDAIESDLLDGGYVVLYHVHVTARSGREVAGKVLPVG
jgi:hypothetical protein